MWIQLKLEISSIPLSVGYTFFKLRKAFISLFMVFFTTVLNAFRAPSPFERMCLKAVAYFDLDTVMSIEGRTRVDFTDLVFENSFFREEIGVLDIIGDDTMPLLLVLCGVVTGDNSFRLVVTVEDSMAA